MKKKVLNLISTISLVLVMVFSPLFIQGINSKNTSENLAVQTRTVEATNNQIDLENAFSEFEDGTLTITQNVTTVEGIKTFKLSDFEELDLVSEANVDEETVKIKYNYEYNNQTNEIILSVTLANEETTNEDQLVGYAFINNKGNIDAEFYCDGEIILLSELEEMGAIENCGWFSRICKTIKKAVSTVAGKVLTAAAVIAPIAVGVIGAVVAAPVAAVIGIGAVVGATCLASAAAVSSSITDGKVDWEAVWICVGVGAVAGIALSLTAYGFTKLIQKLTNQRIYSIAYAVGTLPLVITSIKLNYIEALSILAVYKFSGLFESYGATLIPESLFTKSMLEVLNILRSNNVGAKYLGVYTVSQSNALELAVSLGALENSVYDSPHGTGGFYKHYHDAQHKIHIWFGTPN